MSTVITVENLGKKYLLSHQTQRQPYVALRDVIAEKTNAIGRRLLHPFRSSNLAPRSSEEEFWALQDVSFEIKQGERVGIIGRNGAGKSTLLKILSRIVEPTTGRVRIKGRVASLLEVGTGFHPELTGRENIFLNGAILGMTRAEIRKKFDEIVDFAEIEKFLDTPVKRYSSGMYVRLAFAVAAHLEPEILLVDEVLAVGDAQFQKKCLGKMEDVSAREGRTVLFVSHNMSAIRSLCNSCVMLGKGRLVHSGSTTQVIDLYLGKIQESFCYDYDLSNMPRFGNFGKKLLLQRLRLNCGSGVWHGEPLNAEIDFQCLEDVEGVSFGLGICNRDGVRILSMDSDVPGERVRLKRGQQGTVSFSIPAVPLEPDDYTLDIGSRSGDNFGLDYLSQFGNFLVLPSSATPSVIAMRESGRGGVRLPTFWNFDFSEMLCL
jgi:lipopolysaccharide transport system ATP-binding protein